MGRLVQLLCCPREGCGPLRPRDLCQFGFYLGSCRAPLGGEVPLFYLGASIRWSWPGGVSVMPQGGRLPSSTQGIILEGYPRQFQGGPLGVRISFTYILALDYVYLVYYLLYQLPLCFPLYGLLFLLHLGYFSYRLTEPGWSTSTLGSFLSIKQRAAPRGRLRNRIIASFARSAPLLVPSKSLSFHQVDQTCVSLWSGWLL